MGDVTGYEALQPRLAALMKAHEEDLKLAESLERRMAALMERHATQVGSFPLRNFIASYNLLPAGGCPVGAFRRVGRYSI